MSSNNPSTCADVDKSSDDVFFHIGHSTIVQQEENLDYVDGGEEADGGVEAGIEGGFDSGLVDGDRLLFHGFVDGHGVVDLHLVKLVDAADSVVRQHQSSGINDKLT